MDWIGFNSIIQYQLQRNSVVSFNPVEVVKHLFNRPNVSETEFHKTLLEFCNTVKLNYITVLGPRGPEAIKFWIPKKEETLKLKELPYVQKTDDAQD